MAVRIWPSSVVPVQAKPEMNSGVSPEVRVAGTPRSQAPVFPARRSCAAKRQAAFLVVEARCEQVRSVWLAAPWR
jgi:hypothetical protein